jgi:hypothetical protein
MINYTKIDASNAQAIELAKKSGLPISQVVAFINNQNYRKAYHQKRNLQMKALKAMMPKEVK